MVNMLKNIDAYQINTIHKNTFEQSAASVRKTDDKRSTKSCFFLPRKDDANSATKKRASKKALSTVEVLAVILEGHSLVDHTEYKDRLTELISDDILKRVSSKHRMLRGLVLEELDKPQLAPASKEVGRVLAKMVGVNLIIVDAKRASYYFAEADANIQKTVVVGDHPMERYDTPDIARATFEHTNFSEELAFKTMKIADLRAYALKVFASNEQGSGKREELIRRLELRFSANRK